MTNQTEKVIKGGSFLIEDISYERLFTPEDFTEEHLMIAKTAEDFVEKEVVPQLEHLENHEFDRTVKLLKKAGELGLLAVDVPEEYDGLALDKITSSLDRENGWRRRILPLTRSTRRNRLAADRVIRK
jgi:alkylation response protein AidB-like acyl-CoA dehydrogenase